MKILVLSDTHHALDRAVGIVQAETPDCLIHLGDCVSDARQLARKFPDIPFYFVAGNCDNALDVPDSRFFELEGKRFFITHGHIYNVKYSLMRLEYAGREVEADVTLFGHTHRPFLQEDENGILMNPGAVMQRSYGVIELAPEGIHCSLHTVQKG